MILELAGRPGTGKFTIGRVMAEAMNASLVDNHTIAFSVDQISHQGLQL